MSVAENPRWSACRLALGREPSTVDFFCWMGAAMRDLAAERGIPRDRVRTVIPVEEVTAWLQRRAEAQAAAREKGEADLEGNGVAVVARRDEEAE